MKQAIFLGFVLTLLSIGASAQSKTDLEVISVAKQAAAAQEAYDPAALEKLYASDYIEISPKGEIDVRDRAIGFYKVDDLEKMKAQTPRYVLDEFKVRNYGKFAMVISKFSFGSKTDLQKPATPIGIVIYALRKESGAWKIYSAQFTPFPRPQPTK